jgi:murein DD-endopeptidase MepM/ murein hydrolase activator NlpD
MAKRTIPIESSIIVLAAALALTACGPGMSPASSPDPAATTAIASALVMDKLPAQTAAAATPDAGPIQCPNGTLTLTRFPLDGTNGRDYMIANYLDLDASNSPDGDLGKNIRDYTGKTEALARTYNGHQGLDIVIPNFRRMDSDQAVIFAAAPGMVKTVVQNNDDRSMLTGEQLKTCNLTPNLIEIRAANGYVMQYFHLRKNSAKVKVGDTVAAGTPLAVVGSAGCSTEPHLHFQVNDVCGHAFETLLVDKMWSSPPVYDPPSDIMDAVVLPGHAPSGPEVIDPVPNQDGVAPHATIGVSITAALRGGDVASLRLLSPSSATTGPFDRPFNSNAKFQHVFGGPGGLAWSFDSGDIFGTWSMEFSLNGTVRMTRTIQVVRQIERHHIPGEGPTVLPRRDLNSEIPRDVDAGYRATWIDGYDVFDPISGTTRVRYNLLFEIPAPGVAWQVRAGLTAAQHQTEFDALVGKGFRLDQVDSYPQNGQMAFASVWDTSPSTPWKAYHGVNETTHQTNFNNFTKQGFRPVNISGVNIGGQRFFTALYDMASVGVFQAASRVPISQYQSVFDTNQQAGRRLSYVNVYRENGVPTFTAIFDQRDSGSLSANTALTAADVGPTFAIRLAQGLTLRCLSGFDDGLGKGTANFTTLFTSK